MTNIIFVINKQGLVDFGNKLLWITPEDSDILKDKLTDKILVVDSMKTSIGDIYLNKCRIVYLLNGLYNIRNEYPYINNFDELRTINCDLDKLFIAGDENTFETISEPIETLKIHISIMNDIIFNSDKFIYRTFMKDFIIKQKITGLNFTHYVLEHASNGEHQYIDLLNSVLKNGKKKIGRNGSTISTFKNDIKFDLRDGFPLLTTKKMFMRGIIEELLFFMRGDTDSSILEKKNINIWKGNTDRKFLDSIGMFNRREGVMGPCYGYQWRYFNAKYDETNAKPLNKGIDQLDNIINLINTDPNSRRIMLTSFNPEQVDQCVLPPCHSVFLQFYVDDTFLDMYAVNRSSDVFLGLPFNIASYSLFLCIIAKITNKSPRYLYITLGNTHIYDQHIFSAIEQTKRIPFKFPTLTIPDIQNLSDINKIKESDFVLNEYTSYSSLKAEMIS